MGNNLVKLLAAATKSSGAITPGPVGTLAHTALAGSLLRGAARRRGNVFTRTLKTVGIGHVSWPTFVAGVAAAAIAPAVAAPVLKTLVKAGAGVALPIGQAWDEAKQEHNAKVLAQDPTLPMQVELEQLRTEIATLRAELASAKAAK